MHPGHLCDAIRTVVSVGSCVADAVGTATTARIGVFGAGRSHRRRGCLLSVVYSVGAYLLLAVSISPFVFRALRWRIVTETTGTSVPSPSQPLPLF